MGARHNMEGDVHQAAGLRRRDRRCAVEIDADLARQLIDHRHQVPAGAEGRVGNQGSRGVGRQFNFRHDRDMPLLRVRNDLTRIGNFGAAPNPPRETSYGDVTSDVEIPASRGKFEPPKAIPFSVMLF